MRGHRREIRIYLIMESEQNKRKIKILVESLLISICRILFSMFFFYVAELTCMKLFALWSFKYSSVVAQFLY